MAVTRRSLNMDGTDGSVTTPIHMVCTQTRTTSAGNMMQSRACGLWDCTCPQRVALHKLVDPRSDGLTFSGVGVASGMGVVLGLGVVLGMGVVETAGMGVVAGFMALAVVVAGLGVVVLTGDVEVVVGIIDMMLSGHASME
jgi:hypothetical protein